MNSKALKTLRHHARSSLKSSKLKGPFEREEYMRKVGVSLGASHKQVKRSVRVVSGGFGQKVPQWAKRLLFRKEQVGVKEYKSPMGKLYKFPVWKMLGLMPV